MKSSPSSPTLAVMMSSSALVPLLLLLQPETIGAFTAGAPFAATSSFAPTNSVHRALSFPTTPPPPSSSSSSPGLNLSSTRMFATTENSNGVELISLAGLGDDHQIVGENMAKSLAAWLDDEWMPQEVHTRMGLSVQTTYIQCRTDNITDVAAIMTEVTDNLYNRWAEYDKDAFVNAWDIGNYVADYLIAKSGSETCACSTKIVE